VSKVKNFQLAVALLFIYGVAWVTDLDLGGFGNALLMGAIVFGILALAKAGEKDERID